MNELHFAFRLRQHLNRGLQEIDGDKAERLRRTRERALAVQKQPSPHPVLAGAGHFLRFHSENLRPRHLIAALLLALACALALQWHIEAQIAEMSDLDSALLADDLPVEALIDEDFDSWLKSSQER
ncbi:DUF3619 family protein [Azospira restricta]|uniref:DUF3619 family protein n=1 Tax=Azospira restricta TaxID=404405 RepID=A0A974SNM4_9RHOO|nr:DUF3619 family protein [Azospira restricta]QRJ63458.1 DUF3619 family protein [Azospira restricta]